MDDTAITRVGQEFFSDGDDATNPADTAAAIEMYAAAEGARNVDQN